MNNDLSTSGSTRRSFIKKSVVAAVAVSSMTIFSGLVRAGEDGTATACAFGGNMDFSKIATGIGHQFPDGSIHWVHDCKATAAPGCCGAGSKTCGKFSKTGQMGTLENVVVTYDPLNQQTVQCY